MYNNQIRAFMADVKSMMGRGHESRKGMAGSFGGGLSARVSLWVWSCIITIYGKPNQRLCIIYAFPSDWINH